MVKDNEPDIPFGEQTQQELEKCEGETTLKEQLMCRDRVIMQEMGKSFRAIGKTFVAIDNRLQNIEADIKEIKDNTRETQQSIAKTIQTIG
jgi:hypothetical protein